MGPKALVLGGAVLRPISSTLVPADPPPTTTKLRALVGGVSSVPDQEGWNAQKTQERGRMLQFGLDDAKERVFSEARICPPPVKRALETQRACSGNSCQAVFLPPTMIMRASSKLQRKLDMSCQRELLAVFLPSTSADLEYELLPVASTCSTDCSLIVAREDRAQAILLESRRKGPATSFNVEGFSNHLWTREAESQVKALSLLANEPLVGRIRNALLSPGWSTPTFPRFEGEGDPDLHLLEFWTLMAPNNSEDQLARIFKQSLKGQALRWYYHLEPSSIDSFETLSQEFVSRYSFNRAQPKQLDSLFDLRMGRTEMLKAFMIRFRSEVAEIEDTTQNKKIICIDFIRALLEGHSLRKDLLCMSARSLEDLYRRAEKRIRVEANDSRLRRIAAIAEDNLRNGRLSWRDKTLAACPFFKVSHEEIYEVIRGEPYFRFLNSGVVRQEGADNRRFCRYHNTKGHRIRNCRSFNELLRKLVSEGRLEEFM